MDIFDLDSKTISNLTHDELLALKNEIEKEIDRQSWIVTTCERDAQSEGIEPAAKEEILSEIINATNYRILLVNKLTLVKDALRSLKSTQPGEE